MGQTWPVECSYNKDLLEHSQVFIYILSYKQGKYFCAIKSELSSCDRTVWPREPKTFSIWPSIEKICSTLLYITNFCFCIYYILSYDFFCFVKILSWWVLAFCIKKCPSLSYLMLFDLNSTYIRITTPAVLWHPSFCWTIVCHFSLSESLWFRCPCSVQHIVGSCIVRQTENLFIF